MKQNIRFIVTCLLTLTIACAVLGSNIEHMKDEDVQHHKHHHKHHHNTIKPYPPSSKPLIPKPKKDPCKDNHPTANGTSPNIYLECDNDYHNRDQCCVKDINDNNGEQYYRPACEEITNMFSTYSDEDNVRNACVNGMNNRCEWDTDYPTKCVTSADKN